MIRLTVTWLRHYIYRVAGWGVYKAVAYRHCIVWILSVHKLYFHRDVAGGALAVGKVKTLRVHVKEIPEKHKEKTTKIRHFPTLQHRRTTKPTQQRFEAKML